MQKETIILIIILLIIPIVSSSEYGISVTYDMNDHVDVNNKYVGDIIFQSKVINETLYNINESHSYDITLYDSIQNRFNHSIIINNNIIVQNEIMKFNSIGTYGIKRLSDDVVLGYINVFSIPEKTVTLIEKDNLFDIRFSHNSFIISDIQEKSVNVSLNTSLRTPPGNYDFDIYYTFNDIEYKHNVEFELDKFENFSVKVKSCIDEMPILSHGTFCEFEIENTGNVMTDLTATMQTFSQYFYFPENIGTFPGDKRTVISYYDISYNTPLTGNYLYNVTFNSEDKHYDIPINFTFVDRIFPYFRNFSISTLEVYRPFNSSIEIIENYNLSYAKARIYRKDGGDYNFLEEWDLPHIRFNEYEVNYMPTIEGRYKIEFWAKDRAENLNITEYIFDVIKLSCLSECNNIKFNKVKNGKYMYSPLFMVDRDIEIRISVSELNYGNCSWSMTVRNDDTGTEDFLNNIYDEIVFRKKGNYSIGFKGDCLTDLYNGKLHIGLPDYHTQINDIIFSGQIINYTIPDNIRNKQWNDGLLTCTVDDTGNIETSKYICEVQYPLSASKMDIMPVSLSSYEKTMSEMDDTINEWKSKNSFKVGFIILLFIILFLVIIGGIYTIAVYPYLRFRLGK